MPCRSRDGPDTSMKPLIKLTLAALLWLAHAGPVPAETVTLNLKDADISALISTVAEVTDRNFIIDPRVKGKVTVVSTRPMDSDEVYQVFLSILKVHGFAAVPSGEVIKIVPDVNAKQAVPRYSDRGTACLLCRIGLTLLVVFS